METLYEICIYQDRNDTPFNITGEPKCDKLLVIEIRTWNCEIF